MKFLVKKRQTKVFFAILSFIIIYILSSFCPVSAYSGLIKSNLSPTIYYLSNDGYRYTFPSKDIYLSWYSDYNSVATLSDKEVNSYPIGGSVNLKKDGQTGSDPSVYATKTIKKITTTTTTQTTVTKPQATIIPKTSTLISTPTTSTVTDSLNLNTKSGRIYLQTLLNTLLSPSPNLTLDGVIGNLSKAAIKRFQTSSNLVADGIVGSKTKAALLGTSTPAITSTSSTTNSYTSSACSNGALFDIYTGKPCITQPTETITVCTEGQLFNVLTGKPCTTEDANTKVTVPEVTTPTVTTPTTTTVVSSGGGGGGGGTIIYYATTYTLAGPSSGNVNTTSTNFTVTPDNTYTGTITIALTGTGSTGLSSITKTWSGVSTPQTFTITPTVVGSITLTPTNNGSLTNPGAINYTVNSTVPDAPTSVTATAGNSQATVSFIAPANTGGTSITGYTVTSSPAGGIDSNAGSTSTSHIITGLTNGTAYTFTVVATNSVGSSSSSSVSNTITPIAPPDTTAPSISSFTIPSTATGRTVSILSFTASDNTGVTGYLLSTSNTTPSSSDPSWTSTAPTSYTFLTTGAQTLYAFAKDAAGNISTVSSATTTITTPANIYYVSSTGGDDTCDGHDQTTYTTGVTSCPIKTITKVNTLILSPGDQVLFKKGDIWRGSLSISSSGTLANNITISNYGTGSNPQILGSEQATSWVDQGSNIWMSNTTLSQPWMSSASSSADIFFINTDNTISSGILKTNTTMTSEYNWYWSSNHIYVYSTTNPGTRYNSVEVSQRDNSINLNKNNYIKIDGIDSYYTQLAGIDGGQSVPTVAQAGITISNSSIAFTGYPGGGAGFGISVTASDVLISNNIIHDTGRRGITTALYSNNTISNITIDSNEFYRGNHTTSLDLQIGNTYTGIIDNLTFKNNNVHEDVNYVPVAGSGTMLMFISDQNSSNTGTISNLKVYNNTFRYTQDAAINGDGIDSGNIYNNTFYGDNESVGQYTSFLFLDGCTLNIKNNIFYAQLTYDTTMSGLIYSLGTNTITSDYNIFYRIASNLNIIRIGGTYYKTSDAATIQSTLGWEAHSIFSDPKVISSSDLHLQSNSPAINTGINVGLPYNNTAPDMGAYESSY